MELLLPVVVAHRGEAEKSRQLSEDVYSAIRESDLLGMPISEAYGGLGTPLPEMLSIYEDIAYEDAAVSWVMWNAGLIGFYARYMPQALREELFAGRNRLICQSTIPAGELHQDGGTAVVCGRWPLMSGSPGADWAVLSARLFNDGQPVLGETGMPEIVMAAIPRDRRCRRARASRFLIRQRFCHRRAFRSTSNLRLCLCDLRSSAARSWPRCF